MARNFKLHESYALTKYFSFCLCYNNERSFLISTINHAAMRFNSDI